MNVDRNGVVISNVTAAQQSNLARDYICMWDSEGLPIHINKAVVDYLYASIHQPPVQTQQQQVNTNNESPFIE